MKNILGSEFEIQADMAFLAMGFLHPVQEGMLEQFGVELDERGNVKVDNYQTSVENIFSSGDMAIGQSLVVKAINGGRSMAKTLDIAAKGYTHLS